MTKFGWIVVIVIAIIIAGGAWALLLRSPSSSTNGTISATTDTTATTTSNTTATSSNATTTSRSLIATAIYACSNGKTITAAYYNGPEMPKPKPGEPPQPTGSVDVSFNGAATTTLKQTISADGARYATPSESLVFWNKGNTALVLQIGNPDPNYPNCVAKK